jgi:vitamin K-dependent gamma-carboxylase
VPRLSFASWKILINCLFVLACCFSAGFLFPYCGIAFFIGFSWLFLQDMTFYLNHFYLVVVLNFVYTWLPSNRMFSVDAALGLVKKSNTVPYWTVFLTRYVVSVVYVYAGIAKMNEDWIR